MKILVAHNSYQQVGGEDHVVAAEIAMLEAHGHEVVPYRLSNHAVEGMSRLALGARTIWSRAAFLTDTPYRCTYSFFAKPGASTSRARGPG